MAAAFLVIAVENGAAHVLPPSAFTERQQAGIAHMIAHRGVDALPAAPAAAIVPIRPDAPAASPTDRVSQAGAARLKGYTGECCQNPLCGGFRVRRNGSCLACDDCGSTTGCS